MKAIHRRLSRLENRRVEAARHTGPSIADVLRERRRRLRAQETGLPYEEVLRSKLRSAKQVRDVHNLIADAAGRRFAWPLKDERRPKRGFHRGEVGPAARPTCPRGLYAPRCRRLCASLMRM